MKHTFIKNAKVSDKVIMLMIYQKCISARDSFTVKFDRSDLTMRPSSLKAAPLTEDPIDDTDSIRLTLPDKSSARDPRRLSFFFELELLVYPLLS